MRRNSAARAIGMLVAASLACGGLTSPPAAPTAVPVITTPPTAAAPATTAATAATTPNGSAPTEPATSAAPAGELSASAASPLSVALNWPATPGATGYQLEVQFGAGDFLPVASLPADATSYEHFVVPGSGPLTYRLSAQTAGGLTPVGVAPVSLPAVTTRPISVTVTLVPPVPNPHPPTPDFNNPQGFDPSAYSIPVAVSQVISPEGGLITVTTPSRVAFQLVLPPGAVDEPTRVTLAPVEQADGLPLSGALIAAVQVRPLIPFETPVTLTIAPASGAPAASAVAWAAETTQDGVPGEFWLYPSASQNGASTLTLHRGGTYGLSAATAPEVTQQVRHLPTDDAAQLAQVLAALSLLPPADQAAQTRLLLEGLRQKVEAISVPAGRQKRGGGLASPTRANASPAAEQLMIAIEQAQLVWDNTNAAAAAALAKSLAAKIKEFFDRVKGQCLTSDDWVVGNIGKHLRGANPSAMWAAVAQAFQAAFGAAGQQLLNDLAEGNKSCKFELDVVDSQVVVGQPGQLVNTYKVHTERPMSLKLSYLEGAIFLWGGGEVAYTFYEFALKGCPAVQIKPYPKGGLYITKLQPIWTDGELSNFTLSQVESSAPPGGTFGSDMIIRDDAAGTCKVKLNQNTPPPDLWSPAFAVTWHQYLSWQQPWVKGGNEKQQTWTLYVNNMGDPSRNLNVTLKLTITRLAK